MESFSFSVVSEGRISLRGVSGGGWEAGKPQTTGGSSSTITVVVLL